MADTWNKKEREKKRQQNKKEKEERKEQRKENSKKGDLENMLAYIDENGNISSTPPDPKKRIIIEAADINISVPKQQPLNPDDLIRKGTVSFFNGAKGYGFIEDDQTRESVFVHVNSLTQPIKENNKVTFEVEKGPKGLNAVNVKLVK